MKLALIGTGRMGREIEAVASERGLEVVARLGRTDTRRERAREALMDADVALEFTSPDSAVDNIRLCLTAGCPVVVGTTGWHARLPEVTDLVARHRGSLLWGSNFSTGVALLRAIAAYASALLANLDDFDTRLVETHHVRKKDAPSGTALDLRDVVENRLGRAVGITSVRLGHVPGTHDMVIDGPEEQVLLRHEARSRRVFARGAIRAALWLPGHEGVFTMDDVLNLERGCTT